MGFTDLFYQLTCRKVLSTLPSSSHGGSTKGARVWSQSPGFGSRLPSSPLTSSLNFNTRFKGNPAPSHFHLLHDPLFPLLHPLSDGELLFTEFSSESAAVTGLS